MITQTDIDRFFTHVKKQETGCWEWMGSRSQKGYGRFEYQGEVILSHRFSYMTANGDIPENMLVHHICRNKRCVNPEHLEVVTTKAHAQMITHCPAGHPYDESNTYWHRRMRHCKECIRIRNQSKKYKQIHRKWRQSEKGKIAMREAAYRFKAKKKSVLV